VNFVIERGDRVSLVGVNAREIDADRFLPAQRRLPPAKYTLGTTPPRTTLHRTSTRSWSGGTHDRRLSRSRPRQQYRTAQHSRLLFYSPRMTYSSLSACFRAAERNRYALRAGS